MGGVVNSLLASFVSRIGGAIIGDTLLRFVTLTGPVDARHHVMQLGAENKTPAIFEPGGNGAGSFDVERALHAMRKQVW